MLVADRQERRQQAAHHARDVHQGVAAGDPVRVEGHHIPRPGNHRPVRPRQGGVAGGPRGIGVSCRRECHRLVHRRPSVQRIPPWARPISHCARRVCGRLSTPRPRPPATLFKFNYPIQDQLAATRWIEVRWRANSPAAEPGVVQTARHAVINPRYQTDLTRVANDTLMAARPSPACSTARKRPDPTRSERTFRSQISVCPFTFTRSTQYQLAPKPAHAVGSPAKIDLPGSLGCPRGPPSLAPGYAAAGHTLC